MNENQARAKFVAAAQQYIGCKESNGSHQQIINIYNTITPLPRSFKMNYSLPWCATFVSAMAKVCGMTGIIPPECSCYYQLEAFKRLGRWMENDAYIPSPGDIIYYYWKDNGAGDCTGAPDHVGIVERVQGNTIVVIEGNYKDSVDRRYLAVNGRYIRGFGLPDFASWAKDQPSTPSTTPTTTPVTAPATNTTTVKGVPNMNTIKKGSKGYQVKVAQLLLILNGCSCGSSGADGDFGTATDSAARKYQKAKGLEIDGIIGPATWKALLGY